MDEMKIKLQTKIMKGIIAKVITKFIYGKTGIKPNIQINDFSMELKNGKIIFNIAVDGSIDDSVLIKANRFLDE